MRISTLFLEYAPPALTRARAPHNSRFEAVAGSPF